MCVFYQGWLWMLIVCLELWRARTTIFCTNGRKLILHWAKVNVGAAARCRKGHWVGAPRHACNSFLRLFLSIPLNWVISVMHNMGSALAAAAVALILLLTNNKHYFIRLKNVIILFCAENTNNVNCKLLQKV